MDSDSYVCPCTLGKELDLLCYVFSSLFSKWRDILWSRRLTLQLQNLFMRNPLQVVEVVGKVGHLKSKVFHFGWPVAGRGGGLNWSFPIWSLSPPTNTTSSTKVKDLRFEMINFPTSTATRNTSPEMPRFGSASLWWTFIISVLEIIPI